MRGQEREYKDISEEKNRDKTIENIYRVISLENENESSWPSPDWTTGLNGAESIQCEWTDSSVIHSNKVFANDWIHEYISSVW